MTQAISDVPRSLETVFGPGRAWTDGGLPAIAWVTEPYHILWSDSKHRTKLQKLWNARHKHTANPVILLAASEVASKVLVIGPRNTKHIRDLAAERVLNLLTNAQSYSARKVASYLEGEFARMEEAVVPGLHVKDLLTPYFVRERLRRHERDLAALAKKVRRADGGGGPGKLALTA